MRAALLALALGLAAPAAAAAPAEPATPPAPAPLVLGISAPSGFREAALQAALLQEALSEALGRPVLVKALPDPDATADALAAGRVDFAWISPAGWLRARAAGAAPTAVARLVRDGSTGYRAVFVAPGGRAPGSLDELRGSKVAWLSGDSSATALFARALVRRAGHAPDTFFGQQLLVRDHAAACQAVLDGRADVAATYAYEGSPLRPDGCRSVPGWDGLAVVAASPRIPNDLVAARPGIDPALAGTWREALPRLVRSKSGRRALAGAFRADGFAAPDEAELDAVRAQLDAPAAAPPEAPPPAHASTDAR